MAHGQEVEDYARHIAAGLGVPDFVYRPATVAKGRASREISDGLLVAGGRGLILQVKNRDPDSIGRDGPERARSWIQKRAAEALGQAEGTRRTLMGGGQFVSMRGYERTLAPVEGWPAVVIINHPLAPPVEVEPHGNTVFITLQDWIQLHFRLRSTRAVVNYVERALESGLHPTLGGEYLRYQRLAQADAELVRQHGGLPLIPADILEGIESLAVDVFDELVERVADPTNLIWDSGVYLPIVEFIDSQPVLMRRDIGLKMLRTSQTVRSSGTRRGFLVTDSEVGDRIVFLFDMGDDDESDEDTDQMAQLTAYASVRHTQALESGAALHSRTLAIGIRQNQLRGSREAFVLLQGPAPHMNSELRRAIEAEFGIYDFRHRSIAKIGV